MDPAALSAEAPPAPAPVHRRRVRNYLLDTALQLRLASYLVAVATVLSLCLGFLLWRAWRETSRLLELADPDVAASLSALLAREDRARLVVVACALAVVLGCLLAAAVVVTHRIAGPAYAIGRTCRRVAEGNLVPAPPLRARDLLVELGEEAAGMVGALREREAREREVLVSAAAVLGSPEATDVERREVAVALERLAAEKGRRLAP